MDYYLAEQTAAEDELDGYLQLVVNLAYRTFVVGMLLAASLNLDTLISAFLGIPS